MAQPPPTPTLMSLQSFVRRNNAIQAVVNRKPPPISQNVINQLYQKDDSPTLNDEIVESDNPLFSSLDLPPKEDKTEKSMLMNDEIVEKRYHPTREHSAISMEMIQNPLMGDEDDDDDNVDEFLEPDENRTMYNRARRNAYSESPVSVTVKRYSSDKKDDAICIFDLDNPREYFLGEAMLRVEQKSFFGLSDKIHTILFVFLFRKVRWASAVRKDNIKCIPRISAMLLVCITAGFAFLMSEYSVAEDNIGPWNKANWFVPHILPGSQKRLISDKELQLWGGISRCLMTGPVIEPERLFSSVLLHFTSNHYCLEAFGLIVWGIHVESRYGCIRYGVVTLMGSIGGLLLGLSVVEHNRIVVGLGGAIATHANMFLMDIMLDRKVRVTTKVIFAVMMLAFFLYAIISEKQNHISVYFGGILATLFPCYLYQTRFANEAFEVWLFITTFCITIGFFIFVTVFILKSDTCLISPFV
jgi:membrane associated rhomboid family serine protease